VLTSADGKAKPFVKWVELQMLPPDDLLEIKGDPALREGKLAFRVGLKDPKLVEELGLAKQPVAVVWDSQPLPPDVREPVKEGMIAAAGASVAEFTALAPATLRGPIYIQLQVDRDPRGLVSSLDRRGDSWQPFNLKENRRPSVHITRLSATAQRNMGQAEKKQYQIRPPQAWLPFPTPGAGGEGVETQDAGTPVLVRVDARTPTVRLDLDVGADVAQNYFTEGARVRISVEQQAKEFAADRQATVRLTTIEAGGLQISSDVSDFLNIQFDPIEVKQDKRIEVIADVVGERVGAGGAGWGPSVVPLVLDRTPPSVGQLSAQKTEPRVGAAGAPPQSFVVIQCRADDGQGSGIESVEFVVGFDLVRNNTLDREERQPPIKATRTAEGVYAAEYALPNDAPSEPLLIEAVATDRVKHMSSPALTSLTLPRKVEGEQKRTTFGGKKIEPEPSPGIPPVKKRPK
jgi:hypothetical protein